VWAPSRSLDSGDARGCLDETQIYRIDHYLGKETVQNILGFRPANSMFELVFYGHYVDHIQNPAGETAGMEGEHGTNYDSAGAPRDMDQNHLLQLLYLVAMNFSYRRTWDRFFPEADERHFLPSLRASMGAIVVTGSKFVS
jgi:glucose-6-phosphate 1-dehydrogenase